MKKIVNVEKSWKRKGYVWVGLEDGSGTLRKLYKNSSTGSLVFYYDNEPYKVEEAEGDTYKLVELSKVEVDGQDELKEKVDKIVETVKSGKVQHSEYEKIKTAVRFDIPIYLYGPAGSGKNHTLEQIAEELELDFYFTNSVQQEFKITGFIDAGGVYHETEFYKAFSRGGLFFLDELDASIPEVLVLLNAAIANRYFEFPTGRITAHKDFRVVAAGNTTGDGADEQYTGRLVIDGSTLDRFGYIEFTYERPIELHIAKGDVELVDFIRDIRKQADDNGIRATFSYRAIMMVTTLKGSLPMKEILRLAVFKGLNKDTVNTFQISDHNNQYFQAMKKMQWGA